MTTAYKSLLRDLTLLLCAAIGMLLFIQIPGFVGAYADGADRTARLALDELQKRYPAARKDLKGFLAKTAADNSEKTAAVRQLITTAEGLHRQAVTLKSAAWWEQPVLLAQNHDPRLLRGTLATFQPTRVLHPVWATLGGVWGWLSFAALGWVGRKLFKPRRPQRALVPV